MLEDPEKKEWNRPCAEFRINGTPGGVSCHGCDAATLQTVIAEWVQTAKPSAESRHELGLIGTLVWNANKICPDGNSFDILMTTVFQGRVFWKDDELTEEGTSTAAAELLDLAIFLAERLDWRAVAIDFLGREFGRWW